MMPKFNAENALTWTWVLISVLVVGIYLGMIFSQSEAIEGSFFDFFSALISLGILAIGYQGLHAWRVQDRSKIKREYAQKTIGHLTRILEIKGNLFIPSEAEKKVTEAYHLARVNGYNQEIEKLITDAIRESQIILEGVTQEISELIYSAKSSVICVSVEQYNLLDKISEPFRYYRAHTPIQISSEIPELLIPFSNVDGSNVSSFFFLYNSTGLDRLIQQFRYVEEMIDSLLYVIENGELKEVT